MHHWFDPDLDLDHARVLIPLLIPLALDGANLLIDIPSTLLTSAAIGCYVMS